MHIHYTVMSNSYNLRSAPPSVTELTERFDRNAGGATEPYVSTELVGVGTPMMDVGGDGPGSGQLRVSMISLRVWHCLHPFLSHRSHVTS